MLNTTLRKNDRGELFVTVARGAKHRAPVRFARKNEGWLTSFGVSVRFVGDAHICYIRYKPKVV